MRNIFLLFSILIAFTCQAQNDIKNVNTAFYKEVVFETELYKLYLVKCFARDNVIKVKIRLFNKSDKMIYIKGEEFEFIVNDEVLHGNKTHFIIEPGDIADRMVDVTGKNLKQEKFEINTKGIYASSNDLEVITMKDAEWPDKRGTVITGGPLKCELTFLAMGDVKSWGRYNCTYNGDKLCIINPEKSVAIMPKGQENGAYSKKSAYGLLKGDVKEFPIEFKKYNGAGQLTDGITIKWKETFVEATVNQLPSTKVEMVFDPTQK